MAYLFFFCVMAIVSNKIWAVTILEGPVSVTRDPNEWAEFSCTVACSHEIDWYVEGYLGDITGSCTTTLNGMMACTEVVQGCSSPTSTQGYTERLRLLAKPELASSSVPVQCAAVAQSTLVSTNGCPPFLVYSLYALLTVRPLPTEPPSTPTLPSPSPVVCPSATQSVSVSTLTETVTVTQTVIVTATPVVDPAAFSRGVTHSAAGSHLGKVLTGLFSWAVTALAGLLIM